MFRKLTFSFAVLALAVAGAETFKVTLFQPSIVQGTELKPGQYKVEVENSQVTILNGKEKVQASAKIENVDRKFDSTTVRYAMTDGKYSIEEIRVGGTRMKLVFNR